MTKIKRVKFIKNLNFEHFPLNIFREMPESGNFIVEFAHSFLPVWQKTLSENYAAIEENDPLCEVSISPQSRKNARWKFDSLSIGKCSDDVISRLIKYVMNKYGGDGVETFITFVDDNMPELKELFKQGCSFRECGHLELWHGAGSKVIDNSFNSKIFKDYNKKYLGQITELHNEMIFPQFRQALKIDKEDFKKRFKKAVLKKVLYNEAKTSVEGYFLIFKKNGKLYLESLLSEAFATYYPEILKACKEYLPETTILVKKYHTSSKILADELSQREFKKEASYAILIKDYWALVKEKEGSLLGLSLNISSPA